ncbi:MAG TPA: cellulase family glycosylhydrolase [Ktedonobacteraceae bacterium]|nr:cellulase family glycosylhydrolase [Ktedonobacteraceae bacterium]
MNTTSEQGRRKSNLFIIILLLLLSVGISAYWLNNTGARQAAYTFPRAISRVVYGVNVDISAMIPGSGYTVWDPQGGDFFDLASRLGINTLRITDVRWATTGQERSRATWKQIFDKAASHHINIILLLADGGNKSALEEAHTLLGDYGLASAAALWMVDLANEPDVSDPQQMRELRQEALYVHQVAPKIPVTIGGWKSEIVGSPGTYDWQDPADIPKLINLVDVVSPHLYGFEQDAQNDVTPAQLTQRFLAAVLQQARGKPVLLEEFGASNGLATTTAATPTGGPSWQASVYRSVLAAVSAEHAEGVMGAVAWIIAPRPVWPNSDSYQGDMTGWAFVLNHGQRLLPAAKVFSIIQHSG